MGKIDDGSVSMTINIPGDIYFYKKKLALFDRRSMKQEIFYIIEQVAKRRKIELDHDDYNVKKYMETVTAIPDEYIPKDMSIGLATWNGSIKSKEYYSGKKNAIR